MLYIFGRIHFFFCAFLQDIISIQFTRMFNISMIEFPKNRKKIFDLSFNLQRCYDDLKDVTISSGGRSKVRLSAIFLENWIYKIFSLIFRDLLDQLVRNFARTFSACIHIFYLFYYPLFKVTEIGWKIHTKCSTNWFAILYLQKGK